MNMHELAESIEQANIGEDLGLLASWALASDAAAGLLQTQLEATKERAEEAEAELADYKNSAEQALSETCKPGELHCDCVPLLRARVAELESILSGKTQHDAHAEGYRKGLEDAAKLVCESCQAGEEPTVSEGMPAHLFRGHLINECDAYAIRKLIDKADQ